jgi:hypothetical protein
MVKKENNKTHTSKTQKQCYNNKNNTFSYIAMNDVVILTPIY